MYRSIDKAGREAYLERLLHPEIDRQLRGYYQVLDVTLQAQKQAKRQMLRLGQRYSEIKEFQKVPGVGPVGAHLFDALIQTPHRFFGQTEALALLGPRHPQQDLRRPHTATASPDQGKIKHPQPRRFSRYDTALYGSS